MQNDTDILISKFLSGNMSGEEKERFNHWLKQNAANEKAFNRAEELWNASLALRRNREHDAGSAWEDFKKRAAEAPVRSPKRLGTYAIAASIALLACLSVVILFIIPAEQQQVAQKPAPAHSSSSTPVPTQTASPAPETVTESTPKKKTAQAPAPLNRYQATDSAIVFLLPDSTKVYLNKNSSLVLGPAYGKKERRMELSGEAYFEVKHLPTPFLVSCGNVTVHDIGTAFNIKGNTKSDVVEVNVISGSVELSSSAVKSEPLVLKAGSTGLYDQKSASFEKTKNKKGQKWWKGKGIKNRIKEFFDRFKSKKNTP